MEQADQPAKFNWIRNPTLNSQLSVKQGDWHPRRAACPTPFYNATTTDQTRSGATEDKTSRTFLCCCSDRVVHASKMSCRTWLHLPNNFRPHCTSGYVQVETGLHVNPELRSCPEMACQSWCSVGSYRAEPNHDFVQQRAGPSDHQDGQPLGSRRRVTDTLATIRKSAAAIAEAAISIWRLRLRGPTALLRVPRRRETPRRLRAKRECPHHRSSKKVDHHPRRTPWFLC